MILTKLGNFTPKILHHSPELIEVLTGRSMAKGFLVIVEPLPRLNTLAQPIWIHAMDKDDFPQGVPASKVTVDSDLYIFNPRWATTSGRWLACGQGRFLDYEITTWSILSAMDLLRGLPTAAVGQGVKVGMVKEVPPLVILVGCQLPSSY